MKKYVLSSLIFIVFSFLSFQFIFAASVGSTAVSQTQYFSPVMSNSFAGSYGSFLSTETTTANQETLFDMEVFIPPLGCKPYVVRSDLLEEQNVPVFCQLTPLKINPGIDITRIERINIQQKEQNAYVAGIGFHPARAAIRSTGSLTSTPTSSNLGYVVVVLKKQEVEKDMPDSVNLTLSATLQYGANNAFGIGNTELYLPVMSDADFENNYLDYGFFNGMGYLRVETIDEKTASISIYMRESSGNSAMRKVFSDRIEIGKTSRDFYLPTVTGGQGIRISLKDISIPEVSAKIKVNGQEFEVYEGGSFYNGKCQLREVKANGAGSGYARVYCSGKSFELTKQFNDIDLIVQGASKSLAVNQKIEGLSTESMGNDFYLSYVGEVPGSDPREYYIIVSNISKSDMGLSGSEEVTSKLVEITKELEKRITAINKANSNKDPISFKNSLSKMEPIKTSYFSKSISVISVFSGVKSSVLDIEFATLKNLNRPLLPLAEPYFNKALEAYDYTKGSYSTEAFYINPLTNYGAQSLWAEYSLSKALNQEEKANEILSRIQNEYPGSKDDNGFTANEYLTRNQMFSSSGSSAYHDTADLAIELVSIKEPGFDDSGVQLKAYVDGQTIDRTIQKSGLVYPAYSSTNFNKSISLVSFTEDNAYFNYSCKDNLGSIKRGSISGAVNKDIIIQECSARIVISKINYNKVAKVGLTPIVSGRSRETNFTFAISIEKRAELFQLTPEEASKKIIELNKQIAAIRNITEALGKVIQVEKVACLATSAYVNIKNLFAGKSGEATARKEVMKIWNDKCASVEFQTTSNNNQPSTFDQCIKNNDAKIKAEITITQEKMKAYNTLYEAKAATSGNNNTKLKEEILKSLVSDITVNMQVNCNVVATQTKCETLSKSTITTMLSPNNLNDVTFPELSAIYFDIQMAQSSELSEDSKKIYGEKAYDLLNQVSQRKGNNQEVATLSQKFGGISVDSFGGEKTQEVTTNLNTFGEVKKYLTNPGLATGVSDGTKVKIYNYAGYGNFLAVLIPISGRAYSTDPDNLYKITEDAGKMTLTKVTDQNIIKFIAGFKFIEGDPLSYKNPCKNCKEMKAFVLDPYKGQPALLPFDEEEGWYVQTKQVVQGLGTGNVKTFQDSGRVNTFWLCNVGKNGLVDQVGIADDICRRFDMYTGDTLDSFAGLTAAQAKVKVSQALKALEDAQKQLAANPTTITIRQPSGRSLTLKVKSSEGDIGSKCTDFMSSDDCSLIFNVCDPVVCPNSRCDFGGQYKVDNVIQSGIVGSTLLCLPNFKLFGGDVYIPVCLTGIHAGLDSFAQIMEDYRDCLNESATTGKTVGVCDMIYSVYTCDFFWRQAGPLAETLLQNLFTKIFKGTESKGGGEYMFTQDAWKNAEQSTQFMQSTYGSNSKLVFGVKDFTQAAVAEVCKSPFSVTYPDKFDAMLEPESPVQFTASFEEIPFNDATVPPTSQYGVSYFIYSGNDQGHYYQVYLKSSPTTLGYVGKDSVVVASGYVEKGQKVSFKKDFLDVAGFKQLCVKIDLKEECGFKSVSTSFAINYLKDQAVKSQASTNVTSESECIAGGQSAGAFLTPNIQQGVEEFINPELYNQGIIRVCSSANPGAGVNEKRWDYVGYCDDKTIGCWIDTESVKKAITGAGIENQTLSEIERLNMNNLLGQGGYFSDVEGAKQIANLKIVYNKLLESVKQNDVSSVDSASYSTQLLDYNNVDYKGRKFTSFDDDIANLGNKLIFNKQKAELLYFKGQIYDGIARKVGTNVSLGATSEEVKTLAASNPVAEDNKQTFSGSPIDLSEVRSYNDLKNKIPLILNRYFRKEVVDEVKFSNIIFVDVDNPRTTYEKNQASAWQQRYTSNSQKPGADAQCGASKGEVMTIRISFKQFSTRSSDSSFVAILVHEVLHCVSRYSYGEIGYSKLIDGSSFNSLYLKYKSDSSFKPEYDRIEVILSGDLYKGKPDNTFYAERFSYLGQDIPIGKDYPDFTPKASEISNYPQEILNTFNCVLNLDDIATGQNCAGSSVDNANAVATANQKSVFDRLITGNVIDDTASLACFMVPLEAGLAAGATAISTSATATGMQLVNQIKSGAEVIIKEGTVIEVVADSTSALIGKRTVQAVVKSMTDSSGRVVNNLLVTQTGEIVGQVTAGGHVRAISKEMLTSLGKTSSFKTGSQILKGVLPKGTELLGIDGKVLGKLGESAMLGSESRILRFIPVTSGAFKTLVKISDVLVVYDLFCTGLATEHAFFNAWDAANNMEESAGKGDAQIASLMLTLNRKIIDLNASLDIINADYNLLKIENPDLANQVSSSMISLNTNTEEAIRLHASLRQKYNEFRTNSERQSVGFFAGLVGTKGSEFSDSEFTFLLSLERTLRERLYDAVNSLNEVTDKLAANSGSTVSTTVSSSEEINLLAKMMWSEERSEGEAAMRAAGFVAMNRVGKSSFSSTLSGVLEQTNAFSLNNAFDGSLTGADATAKVLALSLASDIVNNRISDTTAGALYFVNSVDDLSSTITSCQATSSNFLYQKVSTTMYVYNNFCQAMANAV